MLWTGYYKEIATRATAGWQAAFFKYDLRLTKENEASLSLNNIDRAAHVHYSWAYTRNNSTLNECTNFIYFFK